MFPLYHYWQFWNKTIPRCSTTDNLRLLQMLQPSVYLRLTHNRLLRHIQRDSCKIYILLAEFFSLQNCIRSLSGQDTPIPTRVRKAQWLQGNISFNCNLSLPWKKICYKLHIFAKLLVLLIFRFSMSQEVATRSVTPECADFATAESHRFTR